MLLRSNMNMAGRTVACFKQVRLHHEDSYGWTEDLARGPSSFVLFELMQRRGWSALQREHEERGQGRLCSHSSSEMHSSAKLTWVSYLNIFVCLWSQRGSSSRTSSTLPEIEATSKRANTNRIPLMVFDFIHHGADGWKRFKMSKISDKHKLVTSAKMILQALTEDVKVLDSLSCVLFFVHSDEEGCKVNEVMKIKLGSALSNPWFVLFAWQHLVYLI